MKEILRGLYNSIFRKLPIKLLLILLAVFSVLFACVRADFTNYDYVLTGEMGNFGQITFANGNRLVKVPTTYLSSFAGAICFADKIYYNTIQSFDIYHCNLSISDLTLTLNGNSNCNKLGTISSNGDYITNYGNSYCYNFISNVSNDYYYLERSVFSSSWNVRYSYLYKQNPPSSCPSCPDTPSCDYSGYILESEITQNYCVSNGLCPSSDCPIYTGDNSWSALYINDIQHEGAGLINITIPEEISWDYTNNNNIFNLDIEGYNVDTDYINSIIGTQSYTPDSKDFSKVVSEIIPLFVPGLVVILFLYFVFRFIKKIF